MNGYHLRGPAHRWRVKLKQAVEEASANGRDLLQDLAERLDRVIAQTREELKRATNKGTYLDCNRFS